MLIFTIKQAGGWCALMDDLDWEGCQHGVVEGYCQKCLMVTDEEFEKLRARERELFRKIVQAQRGNA